MAYVVEASLCAYCTEWAWSFRASWGVGSIDSPVHNLENCVESDLSTLKLFAQFTAVRKLPTSIKEKRNLVQRAESLPHRRVRGKLVWVWWVPPVISTLAEITNMHVKKRKDYAGQVWLRALSKGPLTSKMARASPRRFTGPA
eukprot:1159034-Pelagomonas_calceolata.AAC.8